MIPVVPSLSPDGWVSTPSEMADYLLSHFFLSEFSRSQLFQGQVKSFVYILQDNQNNIAEITRVTRQTLQTYFENHFTAVEVQVINKEQSAGSTVYDLHIYVGFTGKDGQTYSLGKAITTTDSKVVKIMAINNGTE